MVGSASGGSESDDSANRTETPPWSPPRTEEVDIEGSAKRFKKLEEEVKQLKENIDSRAEQSPVELIGRAGTATAATFTDR